MMKANVRIVRLAAGLTDTDRQKRLRLMREAALVMRATTAALLAEDRRCQACSEGDDGQDADQD